MLGTLRLSQPTLFEGFVLRKAGALIGIFPLSDTHFVPVGWVKPPAAYPAISLKNLKP